MYTFAPLANVMPDHSGFVMILIAAIIILLLVWMTEDTATAVVLAVPATLVVLLAYCVSYVWTDQSPTKVYKNEKVTGEFVRYVAEGYNITVHSGKSTRHVDRHEVYVVYRINGNEVLFRGTEGIEYPKTAVFYKN
jgi:archaellum biogenesis protein FlaJ (TadC family)